jgi:hypothetical protein
MGNNALYSLHFADVIGAVIGIILIMGEEQ